MARKKPSNAQQQFDSLSDYSKLQLLAEVFDALEYDSDGNPGAEWSSDTTETLGQLFHESGVKFTPVDN